MALLFCTDNLTGGAGNDVFVFNSVSDSQPGFLRDAIADFNGNGILAGDRIDLFNIDANAFLLGNQAFVFIGAAAAIVSTPVRRLSKKRND